MLRFDTAFVRPDRLRFRYQEVSLGPESDWDRHEVWWQGGDATEFWTVTDLRRECSLTSALFDMGGVSGGLSALVPRLLLPELQWESPIPPVLPSGGKLAGSRDIEDRVCWELSFQLSPERRETWWIDQATYAIRRIDETMIFTQEVLQEQRLRTLDEMKNHPDAKLRESMLKAAEEMRTRAMPFVSESTTTLLAEFEVRIDPRVFAPSIPEGEGKNTNC